ncbi:MAG: biopolymer transporter ExbD [Kofleriaceae bacterium]
MGMSTGGGKPGSVQSEINVTPLIDVLLVLLIIFLVLIPVVMKMQKLDVPRKINDTVENPDPNASQLTVKVKADLTLVFSDGTNESSIQPTDLPKLLGPKLAALTGEKVVFVDFDDGVPWKEAIGAMDSIRSIAAELGEIKVALKIREDQPAAP